ncbi:MAG: hypothetical protein LKK13_02500 [Bacilli bacterium]|nr:hypothetical protein [Bacilli bacterium]
MKKIILGPLMLSLVLAGCAGQTGSASSQPVDSTGQLSSSSSSSQPEFVSTSHYSGKGVSVSGILSDLSFIGYAIQGQSYRCGIKVDNVPSATAEIDLSVPGIVTFEGDFTNGFTLSCLKVGGTILTVRDSTGFMLYRAPINVKAALSASELADHIVNDVRYYDAVGSFYDSYQLTFISATAGYIKATESGNDYGSLAFTYDIDEQLQLSQDMYGYELTILMDDSRSPLLLTSAFAYATGDIMNVYTKDGIVGLFAGVL